MFVVIMNGTGEGCDYTIGCNLSFTELKANSWEKAKKEVAELIQDHGGTERISKVQILEVLLSETLKAKELVHEPNPTQIQRQKDEDEFERLKQKLNR